MSVFLVRIGNLLECIDWHIRFGAYVLAIKAAEIWCTRMSVSILDLSGSVTE